MTKLLSLFCLAVVLNATSLTGTLASPYGGTATGTLTLAISAQATVSPMCSGSLPGLPYQITVSSGALQTPPVVVGNDCLVPANTYYNVVFKNGSNGVLFTGQWTIRGASFDVGTVVVGQIGSIVSSMATADQFVTQAPGTSLYINTLNVENCTGCGGGSANPTGPAGGDLTGTYPNPGVGKVNGAAIPLSAALMGSNSSRQAIAVTTIPCSELPALTGDTTTTAGQCATTTGKLNGVSLAGLATGLMKNTTGTGAPSIGISTDVINLFTGCSGTLALSADGQCHTGGGGATTNQNLRTIGFSFNGQGSALTGTLTGCVYVSFAGTLNGWYMVGDVSGSGTVGVRSVATGSYTGLAGYSGYTDVVNTGSTPAVSSALYASSTSLTGWVTSVTAGQFWCTQLTSPSTATILSFYLIVAAS